MQPTIDYSRRDTVLFIERRILSPHAERVRKNLVTTHTQIGNVVDILNAFKTDSYIEKNQKEDIQIKVTMLIQALYQAHLNLGILFGTPTEIISRYLARKVKIYLEKTLSIPLREDTIWSYENNPTLFQALDIKPSGPQGADNSLKFAKNMWDKFELIASWLLIKSQGEAKPQEVSPSTNKIFKEVERKISKGLKKHFSDVSTTSSLQETDKNIFDKVHRAFEAFLDGKLKDTILSKHPEFSFETSQIRTSSHVGEKEENFRLTIETLKKVQKLLSEILENKGNQEELKIGSTQLLTCLHKFHLDHGISFSSSEEIVIRYTTRSLKLFIQSKLHIPLGENLKENWLNDTLLNTWGIKRGNPHAMGPLAEKLKFLFEFRKRIQYFSEALLEKLRQEDDTYFYQNLLKKMSVIAYNSLSEIDKQVSSKVKKLIDDKEFLQIEDKKKEAKIKEITLNIHQNLYKILENGFIENILKNDILSAARQGLLIRNP